MANSYTQVYIHLVFAVKNRYSLLGDSFRERVYQYMCSLLRSRGHVPVAIGGTENHVHILICYNVNEPVPDMVRDLKANSSRLINDQGLASGKFEWQRGYGAFSNSHREIPAIKEYIYNQAVHHGRMSFGQELAAMYARYGVKYNVEFMFEDVK